MLVASDLKSLVLKRARAGRCSVFSSKVLLILQHFVAKERRFMPASPQNPTILWVQHPVRTGHAVTANQIRTVRSRDTVYSE